MHTHDLCGFIKYVSCCRCFNVQVYFEKKLDRFHEVKNKTKPYYVQIRKPLMKTIDLHWENNSEFRNL